MLAVIRNMGTVSVPILVEALHMTTFHIVLHRLRRRYVGKQIALATSLGCTEAAISFWEHGRRLPLQTLLPRIVECFRASGAPAIEIEELQQAYDRRRSNHYFNKGGF